jgi:hypothetical protein
VSTKKKPKPHLPPTGAREAGLVPVWLSAETVEALTPNGPPDAGEDGQP